jgi:7-cyano-7-deazaguanine tRNA-ribosyltransferase
MAEFEILHKDLIGRVGKFHTPHGVIETPTIMPVINPNLMSIGAKEMEKYGAEMIIVNAYIIYKKEDLREEAVKKGIHRLLRWEKPIMTDSGSYQLYEYKDVEVSNNEIVQFQQNVGSDIGVPLDIPTAPYSSKEKAKEDLKETIRRMKEAKGIIQDRSTKFFPVSTFSEGADMMLAGVVQGSTFLDLREECAKSVAEIGFDVYPIGGLVPLLESYAFDKLVDIIIASKKNLPLNSPVHVFGAGHPMLFSLAVALGCDLFDSAAYALYAKGKRYITNEGTKLVKDLHYLPCSCPICSSYTADEVKESEDLLASHNLYATFEEMRIVKQSIVEGNLWELCERRCRSHPSLLNALMKVTKYAELMEKYDPSTKHPFFYLGETSAHRPEVLRYSQRLNRFKLSGNVLITTERTMARLKEKDVEWKEKKYDHLFFIKPPFGPYPAELMETYPVGQSEIPEIVDNEAKTMALQNVVKLLKMNEGKAKFVFLCNSSWEHHPLIEEIEKHAEVRIYK